MAERSGDEIMEIFERHDVVAGTIYSIDDIFGDAHYQARQNIVAVGDPDFGTVKMPGVVPRFSRSPGAVLWPGGRLGELRAIRRDLPTLAERVSQAGYATAGFVNVVFLDPGSGLGRGFDRYDLKRSRFVNKAERNAAETTDAALAWLQGVKERPYFLFVHYFDAHQTYDPPPPYDQMFEPDERRELEPGWGMPAQIFGVRKGTLTLTPRQKESLVARYDGEIRFVDEQFGRLRHGMEDLLAGLGWKALAFRSRGPSRAA